MNSENKPVSAEVQAVKQVSTVWLVPIIAVAMGIWMLFQHIESKGPLVTLELSTAEGIEVGKTKIKSLNVTIGVITNIKLSDDYSYIIAEAELNKDAERMLKEDTRFWVVKPRIGVQGITGIDTLLSGSYIELQPGVKKNKRQHYKVLENPPIAPSDANGLRLVLIHQEAGKLAVGDPVLYEGFTVGRVEKVTFDTANKKAEYQLFVFQPYDLLVHENSRFWLNSGINMQVSSEGLNVNIGSVESLLTGGVSFRVLPDSEEGDLVTAQLTKFNLYDSQEHMEEKSYEQYFEYVLMFDESIRGLKIGAPVEFRGIRIGTVKEAPMHRLINITEFSNNKIPVLVHVELERDRKSVV